MIIGAIIMAAALLGGGNGLPGQTYTCHGTGVVERGGPAKDEKGYTGRELVDRINAATVGFDGVALLEDGPELRVSPPEKLRPGGWVDMFQHIDDGSYDVRAGGGPKTDRLDMEWNRLSRVLVLRNASGRWLGRCDY